MSVVIAEDDVPGGAPVVVVDGELDARTAPGLGATLHRLVDEGASSITVDCSRLAFLDSHGLGVLVGASRRLKETGGALHLCGVGTQITRVLRLTRLDQVFVLDEPAAGPV
ncbi:MAG: STAS domain-containing protein [Acidimicrobiales bacterium]